MELKEPQAFVGEQYRMDTRQDSRPTPEATESISAIQEVSCGSIAGIVGKYIEYPFDTVKVRLQSQPAGQLPLYTGPLDCFKKSIARDGFRSLYRGVSAPLFGAALENSSLFLSYRLFQQALKRTFYVGQDPLPMSALFLAGGGAGAVTSLVLTPVELVKCKMQVPASAAAAQGFKPPGPLHILQSVIRQNGFLGLWRGQLGTLVRETGGSVAWFGSYEAVSRYLNSTRPAEVQDSTLPIHYQMLAGASAGMSYNISFYPADTIKSCMQTEESELAGAVQKSFWEVGRNIWREQGFKGLYRGCGITVARSAPSSAFVFTVYEGLKNMSSAANKADA